MAGWACVAAALLLLTLHGAAGASQDGDQHLSDVLSEAAKDTWTTIAKAEHPFQAIREKYSVQILRFCGGSVLGYVGAWAVKFLSLGMLKAAFFAILGTAVAASQGWVGKGLEDRVRGIFGRVRDSEQEVYKRLDLNKDGKVDLEDLKEFGLRFERALLRTNLPFSLGGLVGIFWGLTR
mmetsp:Transcript_19273/g.47262  ORF Transcript_19273/g.47262 Transcript_19273/m.47262 type:complete len:179 (+) Transcript_19273:20-556(+)